MSSSLLDGSSPSDDQSNNLFDCLTSTQGIPQFQFLLQSSINPNIVDLTGISLLTRAVLTEQFNFVHLLLEYGADPLFVYDPVVYDQFTRYNASETIHDNTTHNDDDIDSIDHDNILNNKKNDKNKKALETVVLPDSNQIPLSDLEPLAFIAVHFKTRKIFDALIRALTFEQVLLLRNSVGQSIFEYAAFNCNEHMVMDSLLRYLKGRLDKLTPINIYYIKPMIPRTHWPQTILNESSSPSSSSTTNLQSPTSPKNNNNDDRPVYPPLIRYLVEKFISHSILTGITSFTNLYLLYGADPNGVINEYSNGTMFPPSPQSIQQLQVIQTLIINQQEFNIAQFPHVRYLRWLLGREHPLHDELGNNLAPQLELERDVTIVQSTLLQEFLNEKYIIVAATNGYDDIVMNLIDEGADVDVTSKKQNEFYGEYFNVLTTAFFNGHFKLCRTLLFPKKDKDTNNARKGSVVTTNKNNNDPNNTTTTTSTNPNDDQTLSKINTTQLDSLLTNQIKRYVDPVNLSRVDQFITFRYQQYLQEQRDAHHSKQLQNNQPSRFKSFLKNVVDVTKGAIHDLTEHPPNGQQPSTSSGSNTNNPLLGQGVMVSPVADLIAYNNATQLLATSDHQTQSSIINTILPLPHHMKSLSQLLLSKPTRDTLKNTSRNVEFCRRVYLEPLFIHFCDVNNHLMIESLLKLSLYRRHFILQMQKQSKIEQNEANLQKGLVERCVVPLQQHTVEDEINVADDNDDDTLPEQEEFDHDFNQFNNNGSTNSNQTNNATTTPKHRQSTATAPNPSDLNTKDGQQPTAAQQRRTSTLPPSDTGSAAFHPASSLTAADFTLSNPQLINSRNPHNEYRPMHYSILRLDIELVKILLRYRPQLLKNNLSGPNLGMTPLDFAHHIQTQLRQDLDDEIQSQYLHKLVELGLEPATILSNLPNQNPTNQNQSSSTTPTPAINAANNNHGAVLASPMNRTSAFQRMSTFSSTSNNSSNTSTASNGNNGSNASNTGNNITLPTGLTLKVDWDIVDGELDMGEDDFTPLDDDFSDNTPSKTNQQQPSQPVSSIQSFRQAFAAAKSSQQQDGNKGFPAAKFNKTNQPTAKSNPTSPSQNTTQLRSKPALDSHQSFDLIPDLSQINTALGKDNNTNPQLVKTTSIVDGSSGFTLVEPVIEMESPRSTNSNSAQFSPRNGTAPPRPTRPSRPTISGTSPVASPALRTNTLSQPQPQPQPQTQPQTQPQQTLRSPAPIMNLALADDSGDDILTPMPINKGGVQPNNTQPSTTNSKKLSLIEIGVLLEYASRKYKEQQQQRLLSTQLQQQCDLNHHARFFGLENTLTQTTPHGDDLIINPQPTTSQIEHNKSQQSQSQQPLYHKLLKLLPPKNNKSSNEQNMKQMEFIGSFLQLTPELESILNKIAQLADIIDLLSYFVSVLIAPFQTSNKPTSTIDLDEVVAPLESSISRFGGLGFNPTNINTQKILQMAQQQQQQPKVVPSLVDYYRHKQNVTKLKRNEMKNKKGKSNGLDDDSDDELESRKLPSLTSFLRDDNSEDSSDTSDSEGEFDSKAAKNLAKLNAKANTTTTNQTEQDPLNLQQHGHTGRRNSHFELVAQSIDQLRTISGSPNGDDNSASIEAQERIKEQIDGAQHSSAHHLGEKGKKNSHSDSNCEDVPTTRNRCHKARRVDISLLELSGQSPASSKTTLKKGKSKSMLSDLNDDMDTKYEFSFAEKHRLMLIQLTNEKLNKEDDDFMKLFTSKAREFNDWCDKQRLNGVDVANHVSKFTKVQQMLYDYNEKGTFPDFIEDFFDIDLKTAQIIPTISSNDTKVGLRPSSIQLHTSESSSRGTTSRQQVKRKIRWTDQPQV